MNFRAINIIFGWIMLVLIATSVTFSTLHSHHHLEWDHTSSHVDTGHCLVDDTNVCPVCGYLFDADITDRQPQSQPLSFRELTFIGPEPQQDDLFSSPLTGRSPPVA